MPAAFASIVSRWIMSLDLVAGTSPDLLSRSGNSRDQWRVVVCRTEWAMRAQHANMPAPAAQDQTFTSSLRGRAVNETSNSSTCKMV